MRIVINIKKNCLLLVLVSLSYFCYSADPIPETGYVTLGGAFIRLGDNHALGDSTLRDNYYPG